MTNFPFDDVVNFEFVLSKEITMPLTLRIPSWCREAVISVNGKILKSYAGGQIVMVKGTWKNNDKITLQMPMEVTTTNWGKNSRAIERGPLVYALKLEERWEKGNEPTEGDFMSVYPTQDWNYGLLLEAVKNPAATLEVKVRSVPDNFVWNLQHAPIEIIAPARKIPNWKLVDGVAHQPVTNRTGVYQGEVSNVLEKITLVPYGCTKVRIVAFPVVK